MPLTDLAIRAAKPRSKPYRISDEHALYIEVTPSGSKLWRLKYRFQGKEKRLALGAFPQVGLREARQKRDSARTKLREGVDPSAAKRRNLEVAVTFKSLALEWLGVQRCRWSEIHYARTKSRLERLVFPCLGGLGLDNITPPDVLNILRRLESRGTVETAHRVRSIVAQVFDYAVSAGRTTTNPARQIRGALRTATRGHFAAPTKPAQLATILKALDSYQGSPEVKAALQLAPLLAVRPGELRKMRWSEIDFNSCDWMFIVSKTKTEHVVPLADQAVHLLKGLKPFTNDSPYVFPNGRSKAEPMSENAVLAALRRLGIKKEEASGHGFRATFRTIGDEILGERVDLLEHQLAHQVRDPLGRAYNRTAHLPERRRMMQRWADYLDSLRAMTTPSGSSA